MSPDDWSPKAPDDAEATIHLLARARAGDREALDRLFTRYGPELRRFARGRLPQWARNVSDTPDLVQDTLLSVFMHIDGLEYRGEGALRAYMRQAVMNRIRNELRGFGRRPTAESLPEDAPDERPSPLEEAIGHEAEARYEAALATLSDDDREAIIARVEMGLTFVEIAEATGRPSANAARMAVVRALLKLAEEMDDGRTRS
jgi:RNA polymerase sigma factor (sigma-70 family)